MATLYPALPGCCFEFAIGMCAAAWVARPQAHHGRLEFACLLLGLARVPGAVFLENGALRSLNFVGTFSFSLYVVHTPLLAFLNYLPP